MEEGDGGEPHQTRCGGRLSTARGQRSRIAPPSAFNMAGQAQPPPSIISMDAAAPPSTSIVAAPAPPSTSPTAAPAPPSNSPTAGPAQPSNIPTAGPARPSNSPMPAPMPPSTSTMALTGEARKKRPGDELTRSGCKNKKKKKKKKIAVVQEEHAKSKCTRSLKRASSPMSHVMTTLQDLENLFEQSKNLSARAFAELRETNVMLREKLGQLEQKCQRDSELLGQFEQKRQRDSEVIASIKQDVIHLLKFSTETQQAQLLQVTHDKVLLLEEKLPMFQEREGLGQGTTEVSMDGGESSGSAIAKQKKRRRRGRRPRA